MFDASAEALSSAGLRANAQNLRAVAIATEYGPQSAYGAIAKRLCSGLQSRVGRFDSGSRLQQRKAPTRRGFSFLCFDALRPRMRSKRTAVSPSSHRRGIIGPLTSNGCLSHTSQSHDRAAIYRQQRDDAYRLALESIR
ncbi:hypothetical protein BN2476_170059 [Paraburkholderia piptadeniae]|uniref:Uncharacterized protein n=1 Tax=Paraburkholderia piptadeniae TaxID=1701573 RepID=A0A1N7RT56_9BURK|nr:hypothetical protein BN2476_170059 [Paraburkholderia piptadeniae]